MKDNTSEDPAVRCGAEDINSRPLNLLGLSWFFPIHTLTAFRYWVSIATDAGQGWRYIAEYDQKTSHQQIDEATSSAIK